MVINLIDRINLINKCKFSNVVGDKSNRHKIIVRDNGYDSEYLFSAPVIEQDTGKIVSMRFEHSGDDSFKLKGTNCTIYIQPKGVLFDGNGQRVRVSWGKNHEWVLENNVLISEDISLFATTNGVLVQQNIEENSSANIFITSSHYENTIRANSKYFALMKEKHVPSFIVSTICFKNKRSELFSSVVKNQKENDRYKLSILGAPSMQGDVFYEINMYEHKLLQDTTVELIRPTENNAFGSVAFVGTSQSFGEQRLYMKFDYSMLGDINTKKLKSIRLFIPSMGDITKEIEVCEMNFRFCSFGSTWSNKIMHGSKIAKVSKLNTYYCIELTDQMIDSNGNLKFSNGIMIRIPQQDNGYTIMFTGDSCVNSPIIEIEYCL